MKRKSSTTTKWNQDGKTKCPPEQKSDASRSKSSPVPKRRENKLDQSLRALSLTREDVERCPQIASVLKQSVGSIAQAIEAMRFSDDPTIRKFLLRYDTASEQQRRVLPLEAFALSAAVEIPALLGATILAFKSLQAQKSTLTVMAEHPEVVRVTIDQAKKAKGVADRRMIHEAVGFLPTKTGVSIQQVFGGQLPKRDEQPNLPPPPEANGEAVEFDELFEPITKNLETWQSQKQKLLRG